jgi:hypothetical protein
VAPGEAAAPGGEKAAAVTEDLAGDTNLVVWAAILM